MVSLLSIDFREKSRLQRGQPGVCCEIGVKEEGCLGRGGQRDTVRREVEPPVGARHSIFLCAAKP